MLLYNSMLKNGGNDESAPSDQNVRLLAKLAHAKFCPSRTAMAMPQRKVCHATVTVRSTTNRHTQYKSTGVFFGCMQSRKQPAPFYMCVPFFDAHLIRHC